MHLSPLVVAILATLVSAQNSIFKPLRPPAIPLAVRSPYMSTWQQAGKDGGNGGYLAGQWPTFWQGQITGWCGMIRVDNATYTWMGLPSGNPVYANQTAFEYTSTRSIFTMAAGPVEMTIGFLSGITPNDLLRSSLPVSYLNVDVKSTDGKPHHVQLYSDISAEWVSGDHGAVAQWSYGNIASSVNSAPTQHPAAVNVESINPAPTVYGTKTTFNVPDVVPHTNSPISASGQGMQPTNSLNQPHPTFSPVSVIENLADGGIAYHKVFRQQQLEFSSINQQADWGNWYYSTANENGLTFQSGEDNVVRSNFVKGGTLANKQDTNFRAINNAFPVFGYAKDLGMVGSATKTTLFQLSLHQDRCIQFQGQGGVVQKLPCLWKSYFSSDVQAIKFFYNDHGTASAMATGFDSQVSSDSIAAGGSNYRSLTSLAVRQAFGATVFARTPTDPLLFMKEISSDGNANTVDVIFPFHPIAIYSNATLLKYLLDPLFINQEAGNWPNKYSVHDIGSNFPNATGHSDGNAEAQPLEECGNMLIMTLAYAQRANDNAYLSQHYQILKQWTGYLVDEALIPANQISTDDFAGAAPNQTNLAIKGIIGINAMAQIANRTGHVADGHMYTNIALDYIKKWQGFAINSGAKPPHTKFNYNNENSFSLLYNIFGDRELGTNLVPQSVYDMQSAFYPTVFKKYGVPLDTRHTYTKGDWEIFCAAVASPNTKTQFINAVAKWLGETPTNFPFTDYYETISGDYPPGKFIARPTVGGMFAVLALNSAPRNSIVLPS